MHFTMFLIVLISQLPQVLLLAQAQQREVHGINFNAVYRLSNSFAGTSKFLSVSDDDRGVDMADSSRSPKQLWKLIRLNDSNKCRLVNLYAGEDKSLDVNEKGDYYSVVMGNTGDYSGQSWTLTHLGGGKYRLTNDYIGEDKSLDIRKSGDQYSVVMGDTGDYSGQSWSLTKATQQE